MAYYYKINDSEDTLPPYKGFHLQKVKERETSGPNINYDFSKHVLIELLDDITPESKLWSEMKLNDNKNVIHKRMMMDPHRIKCRRAIVICISSDEAKQLAQKLCQMKVMNRCICAVVIKDLLFDLCLFEKQIIQFGDSRSQNQLLYVSDMSRSRGPSGMTQFLKEKFSSFGTILSIFVCSDDDDYAYPEGIIKFTYLSEAFAAELAFDQFVVAKERLSVTTHHNILLSQCDLRVRLRNAQWCCNVDNNQSSKSLFCSFNNSYKLNDLVIVNDSVESSMNNLRPSHIINSKNVDDNSVYDTLEDTLPAFSQRNLHKNSPNNDFNKTVSYHKKKNSDREQNSSNVLFSIPKNSLHCNNVSNFMNNDSNIVNSSTTEQFDKYASETVPFEMSTAKNIDLKGYRLSSKKNVALESLLNFEKNTSDCASFVTCHSTDPNSNILFLSPKKSSYRSFHSQKNNSVLQCQSVSSKCKQSSRSSLLKENICDFEVIEECAPKQSKKRKKKFTPSQKLCLKSQRTGLSEDTQISDSNSSQQENSQKYKHVSLRKEKIDLSVITDWKKVEFSQLSEVPDSLLNFPVENELSSENKAVMQNCKKVQSSVSMKVSDWLLHLPASNTESSEVAERLSDIPTNAEVEQGLFSPPQKVQIPSGNIFTDKKKLHRSTISIYRTPALKSDVVETFNYQILHPDNGFTEYEDPHKIPLISSTHTNPILLTAEYKSPLQMWLKQELISSTCNNAFESKEPSKSIIVCATKTRDIIISVGCSHMACDTCYPESTDLLLGYC